MNVTIVPDENAPELREGYAIDVAFTIVEEKDTIAVPKLSLFPYEEKKAVFTVKEGKVKIQKVETGLETTDLIVIKSGLDFGSQIIKNPKQEGLKEGVNVKRRDE